MKKFFVPVISLSMCLLCGVVLASSAIFALRSSSATFSVSLSYTQTIKSKIEFALNDKTTFNIIYANVGFTSGGVYSETAPFPVPEQNIVSDTSQDYSEGTYSYNITLNSTPTGLYKNAKCADTFWFRITNYTNDAPIMAKIIPEASTAGALRNSIVKCDDIEVPAIGVVIPAKTTTEGQYHYKDFEISILVFEETNISFKIELTNEIQ